MYIMLGAGMIGIPLLFPMSLGKSRKRLKLLLLKSDTKTNNLDIEGVIVPLDEDLSAEEITKDVIIIIRKV